ncbi:uncharacterized protein LTR77_005100 [Saxophila tyrrhenica]|uniref:Uncharacterized protein n=1 Tax=Saxophila tyrrhenica TaxID=1690608 RepID=A0AAV9PEE8_9PEZI|nr:hypothetical protein LTR77_005100 [Saxophila tyrrhenica]
MSLAFVFASVLFAQSLALDPQSNTCLRRTLAVYTSASETYVVTDLGTTSFAAPPSFCPNVSVSTSTSTVIRQNTITITEQNAPAEPSPTQSDDGASTVADAGFEDGDANPFNTSSSGPEVTAQVAQGGQGMPLQPYAGDSFLLITFNNSGPSGSKMRRQAPAPLFYNVSQGFAAVAGKQYTFSAYAAVASNGGSSPDCSITICDTSSCGASVPITSSYSQFTHSYNAVSSDPSAIAIFSITCAQSASVALDNLEVSTGRAASNPAGTTVFLTSTLTVTQSQRTETLTQMATGPNGVITATTVVNVPQTQYLNLTGTASSLSTTTTTITRTLNYTTSVDRPSVVVETAYATLTPFDQTHTLPQATYVETSIVYSTEVQTSYLTMTLPQETQSVPYTLPAETHTPPAETTIATFTLSPSLITRYITLTPPPETMLVQVTPPAATLPRATETSIPPAETTTATLTLSPSLITEFITLTPPPETTLVQVTPPPETTVSVQSVYQNVTLPQITETSPPETSFVTVTLPATTIISTVTITPTPITEFRTETLPAETSIVISTEIGTTVVVQTETLPQATQTNVETTTEPPTTILAATTELRNITYTTAPMAPASDAPPPPPAVALASPTPIIAGADVPTYGVDDDVYPITLPFPVTMYGQSNSLLYVTSNGVISFANSYAYSNTPMPAAPWSAAAVLGLWSDLYIYQNTDQGIYYQVDGASPNRQATFEFYLSHISSTCQYYHFLIKFYENLPNFVNVQYLNVSDNGGHETVGIQSGSGFGNKFVQLSYNQPVVYPGMDLLYYTEGGTNGNGVIITNNPGDSNSPVTDFNRNDCVGRGNY